MLMEEVNQCLVFKAIGMQRIPMSLLISESMVMLVKFGKFLQISLWNLREKILAIDLFFSFRNFRFGDDVMEIVTSWTKDLCVEISQRNMSVSENDVTTEVNDQADKYLSSWNVLDLGTGNGLLLHQLAKEG